MTKIIPYGEKKYHTNQLNMADKKPSQKIVPKVSFSNIVDYQKTEHSQMEMSNTKSMLKL